MFCSHCGKPLDPGAKFCPNCGSPIAAGNSVDDKKEIVIKEGLCNRCSGKLYVENGHGMLTNKRFIYSKHSLAKIAAIGILVNLTKGSFEFDIPISEITGIRDGKHGLSKTIIITTKQGNEYNFYFTDRERWKIEFNNLIQL